MLSKTEEELRKAVRSNLHAILARVAKTLISEIDIPLCRMVVNHDRCSAALRDRHTETAVKVHDGVQARWPSFLCSPAELQHGGGCCDG